MVVGFLVCRTPTIIHLGALDEPAPPKTLGWKTPEEAMAEELAAFRSTVALET
jgi:hypothetical protein